MRAIFVLVAYAVVLIMAASVLDGCPASDKSDVPPDVNILDVIPDSTSDGDATSFEDAKAYGYILGDFTLRRGTVCPPPLGYSTQESPSQNLSSASCDA